MSAMRSCAIVGLILASMLATAQTTQAKSVSVSLRDEAMAPQRKPYWCWAASVSNLFAYHGHRVSQARIVTEVYGSPVNMASGDYSNMARLLNRTWRDDDGRAFGSRLVAALDVMNGINSINNDEIRDALEDDRPLIIGTTSHAMLVVGMTYTEIGGRVASVSRVRVYDPWPGQGFRDARPEEITPAPLGGTLMFVAEAQITGGQSRPTRKVPVRSRAPALGRSCQTQLGRCGPFYDQPALPVGTGCYCATLAGPIGGIVTQP